MSVTDLREDFMVGSPKSLQTIANQAQQTLRELEGSMSNLTPKDWQTSERVNATKFTQNTNGTAYISYANIFGKGNDKFTIECLYYDLNLSRYIPIPYISPDDFGNVTIKQYFTYQITIDSTSQRNVTAKITISKALYDLIKEYWTTRFLRIICRRYEN